MKLRIKEFRKSFFLTQQQLAEKIGSTQRNISNWENCINEPDIDAIVKLSQIFGVTVDELLGLSAEDTVEHANFYLKGKDRAIDKAFFKLSQELSSEEKAALIEAIKALKK